MPLIVATKAGPSFTLQFPHAILSGGVSGVCRRDTFFSFRFALPRNAKKCQNLR